MGQSEQSPIFPARHDDLKLGLSQKSKEVAKQRTKISGAPNNFITRQIKTGSGGENNV
jgi:hypothetical protein